MTQKLKINIQVIIIGLIAFSFLGFENYDSKSTELKTKKAPGVSGFPIVGTNQTKYYDNRGEIKAPGKNDPFYGQDATYPDDGTSYTDNGDGTISDNITGLMWIKARGSRMTWDEAVAGASKNNTGGYGDWRMPTIKELYSLFLFSGKNGSGVYSTDGYVPFINTDYFDFKYGSGSGQTVISGHRC